MMILLLCRPKSDTCKTCDSLNVKIQAEQDPVVKQRLQGELAVHQAKAEGAFQQLKEDIALAKSDTTVKLITFDLEQTLPTPSIPTNVAFYKRQLWTYNLGIHDGDSGRGCMHMWHEGVAGRGSYEIASCVMKHLKEMKLGPYVTHLITYSDSCGGQNRNINMVCAWLNLVMSSFSPIQMVDQKFMLSGHSYLPNDRDFASIENAKRKRQTIYCPEEWYSLVENARTKNPFSVCVMESYDFWSLDCVKSHIINRKKNTRKEPVNWFQIHWIRVIRQYPYCFQYRHSLSELEPWKTVNLTRKGPGRPPLLGNPYLPLLFDETSPRTVKKKRLMTLFLFLIIFLLFITNFIRVYVVTLKIKILMILMIQDVTMIEQ